MLNTMDSTPAYEEATGDRRQQEQKPAPLPSPNYTASMTSKPNVANKDAAGSATGATGAGNNPFAGNYFNVAQKGKLILPTALWILIVIAGFCFLSLFATLNKTLVTLESVEQNQHDALVLALKEKEGKPERVTPLPELKHDHHKCRHKHHNHKHHPISDSIMKSPARDLLAEEETNIGPLLAEPLSLFRLPDWTSLEPRPLNSMVDGPNIVSPIKMIGGLLGAGEPDSAPIASGSIIIESKSPLGQSDDETMGIIDSILRQVSGIFGETDKDQNRGMPLLKGRDGEKVKGQDSARPLINANIDKVEINVNSRDSNASEKTVESKKNKKKSSHADDIGSFEKSVDDLVAKILGTPELGFKPKGEETLDHIPHKFPTSGFKIPTSEFKKHEFGHPLDAPLSPLASLLMPYNVVRPPVRQEIGQEVPRIPDGMQPLVISLGDIEEGPDEKSDKLEIIDLGPVNLAPELRPSLMKLQQEQTTPQLKPLKAGKSEDPVMNAIAEEMASSVLNNILPIQPPMKPFGIPAMHERPEPIESMPIIIPPKPSMPEVKPLMQPPYVKVEELSKSRPENSVGDLFASFFGPPPRPQMFDAPKLKNAFPLDEREEVGKGLRLKEQTDTNADKVTKVTETSTAEPLSIKIEPVGPSLSQAPITEMQPTTASPAEQFISTSTDSANSGNDDESQSDVGPFLESLFSNVFSLPQYGSGQDPMKVEAQQSGTSKPEGK